MTLNILIVDDSPVMRSFIKRILILSGLEIEGIFEAGNGLEALTSLQARSADLILSDINMPVMNGEEFMRALQADEAFRGIPTIVVSTDARTERVDLMLAIGAKGYVTKPFAPEVLRAEVERVLEAVHA
jgi:two-component system, chemotaxis family, chemotaxis protein CheY